MRLNLQFFFDLLSSVQYTDETPKLSLARTKQRGILGSDDERKGEPSINLRMINHWEPIVRVHWEPIVRVTPHPDKEKNRAEYLITALKLEYPVQSWILLPQPVLKSYS